jgi:hypothetical protein
MDKSNNSEKTSASNEDQRYITPQLLSVKHIDQFRLNLCFTDGFEKVIDFEGYLRQYSMYKRYLKSENFLNYQIRFGNLIWPGNVLDFHYSTLYNWPISSEGDN